MQNEKIILGYLDKPTEEYTDKELEEVIERKENEAESLLYEIGRIENILFYRRNPECKMNY